MKILIDADGCPVVDCTIQTAREYSLPVVIFCDSAHLIHRDGAETVTVSKGRDSADFALLNHLEHGDVVITQDYGLAALCLAKNAYAIHQDGMLYTESNIDGLLFSRYTAQKIRRGGGSLKGPPPRSSQKNNDFVQALRCLLEELLSEKATK